MTHPLIELLISRHGISTLGSEELNEFLDRAADGGRIAVLFVTGDPQRRVDTADVAVVLGEVLQSFDGRLSAAIVSRQAEAAAKLRFHVSVEPSLVLLRGRKALDVLPRVLEWSEYLERVGAALLDTDALAAGGLGSSELEEPTSGGS